MRLPTPLAQVEKLIWHFSVLFSQWFKMFYQDKWASTVYWDVWLYGLRSQITQMRNHWFPPNTILFSWMRNPNSQFFCIKNELGIMWNIIPSNTFTYLDIKINHLVIIHNYFSFEENACFPTIGTTVDTCMSIQYARSPKFHCLDQWPYKCVK